jgi:hypothetical protein
LFFCAGRSLSDTATITSIKQSLLFHKLPLPR